MNTLVINRVRRLSQIRPDWVQCGQGVSAAKIRDAEIQLSLVFPNTIWTYLAQLGWATLGYSEIFGLGKNILPYCDIIERTLWYRTQSGNPIPSSWLALADDGAGNIYGIDVTNDNNESIVLWNHEVPPYENPFYIAPSFDAWILQLCMDVDRINEK